MKDSIPDMSDDAVEVEGSTTIGYRGRRRYVASGTLSDPADSSSITIRAVFQRDASAYPAQNDRATNQLARDAFAHHRREPFAHHGVRFAPVPRTVPAPHRLPAPRLSPAIAALPVPSIAQAHFAIGPWLANSNWSRDERARRLAPYERTQLVRADVPPLVWFARAPSFNARWLAIYLLSTVIVAVISAIAICLW